MTPEFLTDSETKRLVKNETKKGKPSACPSKKKPG
jgi:hypothetical protein